MEELFNKLIKIPCETEYVDFKEAKTSYNIDDLGKYFSAISNEANLHGLDSGWIIFGVNDKHEVVGTDFKNSQNALNELKHTISQKTTGNTTFRDIIEIFVNNKRVLIFVIPASLDGIPVAWGGHYYGRNGSSLVALSLSKQDEIRKKRRKDWSIEIVEDASLSDLSDDAIKKAREEFAKRKPEIGSEIKKWNDEVFLNKAKITINSKITKTAIILLGKTESEHFISPSVAKISWILRNEKYEKIAYEHFGPPFILNTENILSKIRNIKYIYLPDNTLFPEEILKYDNFVIREAIHNCIAHQDYTLNSKIIVDERSDELEFVNAGSFIPGTIENVIEQDAPQLYNRNSFLINAMESVNMIESIGSGIRKMYNTQKDRSFPLPSYKITNNEVSLKIFGKVLDINYSRLIFKNTNIDLRTVMLLDRVQKKERITREGFIILKKMGFIEGRYPNCFISSYLASVTGKKAEYIKNRGLDNIHFKELIISYLKKYKNASRSDIESLLISKFSETLSEKQKKYKVNNILNEMANKNRVIKNIGSDRSSKWILINKNN